jgi:hypothetical protein
MTDGRWILGRSGSVRKALLFAVLISLILLGLFSVFFVRESHDFVNYEKVQDGMSVEEVQAILGPGTPVKQEEVPGIVVAVNPQDAEDFRERARKSGGSPPTARDYPTRIKPVVEGDYILRWVNSRTKERILVAFKDGRVCEKNYYDPNYL